MFCAIFPPSLALPPLENLALQLCIQRIQGLLWDSSYVVTMCIFCYAGSYLGWFYFGFFQSVFPSKGFLPLFFPLVNVGQHPPKSCYSCVCPQPVSVCVRCVSVCTLSSTLAATSSQKRTGDGKPHRELQYLYTTVSIVSIHDFRCGAYTKRLNAYCQHS